MGIKCPVCTAEGQRPKAVTASVPGAFVGLCEDAQLTQNTQLQVSSFSVRLSSLLLELIQHEIVTIRSLGSSGLGLRDQLPWNTQRGLRSVCTPAPVVGVGNRECSPVQGKGTSGDKLGCPGRSRGPTLKASNRKPDNLSLVSSLLWRLRFWEAMMLSTKARVYSSPFSSQHKKSKTKIG